MTIVVIGVMGAIIFLFWVIRTFAFVMSGSIMMAVETLISGAVVVEVAGVGRTGGAYFCQRMRLLIFGG